MLLKRLSYLLFLIFAFNCSSGDGSGNGSDQINTSALSFGDHVLIDKSRTIRYSQTGYDQGALESLIQTTLNE